MNYLSADNLSKHFGDKTLFEQITFGLSKGDKVALIAPNGAGKTTLMRMLARKEEPDTGKVSLTSGLRTAFLEQQPQFQEQLTVNQLIQGSHTHVLAAIRQYEQVLKLSQDNMNAKGLSEATALMDKLGAWDYERRLKQLLDRFSIRNLDSPIGTFSGGQRKRLALALALLDEPDLLLLDEPTNHLDIDMIEWLEKYLKQTQVTFLMVTHDRYFLDRVCNGIFELAFGTLYEHRGNYSYYVRKSNEREESLSVEREKAGQLLKKEQEWMRRMPKARTTKSKSRIDAFYDLKEKAGQKRLQKQISLNTNMSRLGSKILELKNVSKSFGSTSILSELDLMFNKGERYGIIGKNGVGKTTFLNLISGKMQPDSGQVISGDTVVYGYFSQESQLGDENRKVIDVVRDVAEVYAQPGQGTATASQMLYRFHFPAPMHHQPVSLLSGGEKRRLLLLMVLVQQPNFLILDEPTNDLDIPTLEALEDFIRDFKGCLIVVSHDRYFMDEVVGQLLVFEGAGVIRGFVGNYSDYRDWTDEQEKLDNSQQTKAQTQTDKAPKTLPKKRSFKEQKEYDLLEQEIALLEQEKSQLESALNSGTDNYQELEQCSRRIEELIGLIDEKSFRWLELDELG
jgi:ABC transport system ATP-binding/permease protein